MIIITGLIVRVTVAVIVVTGNKFNVKEKVFIAFSWLPKATVQVYIIYDGEVVVTLLINHVGCIRLSCFRPCYRKKGHDADRIRENCKLKQTPL